MGTSLVLKGANFIADSVTKLSYQNEISEQVNGLTLAHGYSTGTWGGIMKIKAAANRACVLVAESNILVRTTWENDLKGKNDVLFIPKGTKKITIKTTLSGFRLGLTLSRLNGQNIYDSGWQNSGTEFSADVSQLSQNENLFAGSTCDNTLDGLSLADIGYSITIE